MSDKPTATEAFNLMVRYYQAHPYRGFGHALVAVATGGLWATWFLGFWLGLLLGLKDADKIRALDE